MNKSHEERFLPRIVALRESIKEPHDPIDAIVLDPDGMLHPIHDVVYVSLTEHQHILAEKEKRIEKLREALEFYSRVGGPADTHDRKGCWILARRFCFTEAIAHDIEKLPIGETGVEYYIAGKRARAALQEDEK